MPVHRSKSSSKTWSGSCSSASVTTCALISSSTDEAEPKKIMPCRCTMSTVAPYCSRISVSELERCTLERSSSSVVHSSTPECAEYSTMKMVAVKSTPSTTAQSIPSSAVRMMCRMTRLNSRTGNIFHAERRLSQIMLMPIETSSAANMKLGITATWFEPVSTSTIELMTTIAGGTKDRAPMSHATSMPVYVTVGTMIAGAEASCEKPACRISLL